MMIALGCKESGTNNYFMKIDFFVETSLHKYATGVTSCPASVLNRTVGTGYAPM
ncbi:MAG: hypothetical protein ACKVRP_05930 [Bacteroidota bacterium]